MLLIPLALIHAAESVRMDGCHPSPDLLLGVKVTTEPLCCTDEKTLRLLPLMLSHRYSQTCSQNISSMQGQAKWGNVGKFSSMGVGKSQNIPQGYCCCCWGLGTAAAHRKTVRAEELLAEQARPTEFPWKKKKGTDVYVYF